LGDAEVDGRVLFELIGKLGYEITDDSFRLGYGLLVIYEA